MNNNQPSYSERPTAIRVTAKVISYIFHPLFIPIFVVAYLLFLHPYSFAALQQQQKVVKLISFFVITVFFPGFTVLLLWRLQFADSIFLRTQKERIIPYVATIIYFFWAWYVSRNQAENPPSLVFFLLGLFVCASAALTANNYLKISMHALGVGGLMAFMILLGISTTESMGLPVSVATIVTGLVCTSRLIISDHTKHEVYWGLALGAASQLVAWWIVM